MTPFSTFDVMVAAPEITLLAAACIILVVDLFLADRQRAVTFVLSMVALLAVACVTAWTALPVHVTAWSGMYVADPMGAVLKLVTLAAVAVTFLYSRDYLQQRGLFKGEYFILGLFATLGILVMISAYSLLTMYLGVEILALSLYAMVAFDRDSPVAAEAAMKYFVLGAIASGTLLYGISIIYGVTGTFEIPELAIALAERGGSNVGLLFGLAFVIVGIGFKFGAVPFHMWIPDVYHGAPTTVTLFLGSAPKIASFALAIRVLAEGLGPLVVEWQQMLIVLSVLSMAIGNIVAIAQTNLKRMLAYSTISHVGFILLGILSGSAEGYQASMFYTITYVIMAIGSFGMIILLSRRGFEADRLEDFKGLNARSPWFAWMMLMLMVSTAGVPPFVGFFAKLYVIQAVLNAGLVWLAVVAVLFSVIGAFYYLRIIKLMFFDEPVEGLPPVAGSQAMRIVLTLNALAVLVLGLFNGALLNLCMQVLPALQ